MSALSPASSPRLPSPPPMAEDQLGPLSPAMSSEEQGKAGAIGGVDHSASRRIRPGTKSADMAEGPPLVDLKDVSLLQSKLASKPCIETFELNGSQIDSAFQLTEHLKALHNSLTHPEDANHNVPVDRTTALRLAQPPDGVDRNIWLYELCRFLSQKANSIIIALFADDPPCSAQTCPEMRASEWQYLCAVHDPPKSCCAIDYCCHTLDWAANTLTSPKSFPSRLALGTEMNNQHTQVRQLTNIFRRVYRIFAHAWFQHRDIFWKVEGRTGLYMFFKTVCDVYNLIDRDNYTIPQEAEGLENEDADEPGGSTKDASDRRESVVEHTLPTAVGNTLTVSGNTTKRHRQTPSLSQAPVTTVVEETEEDDDGETSDTAAPKGDPARSKIKSDAADVANEGASWGREEGQEAEQSMSSKVPEHDTRSPGGKSPQTASTEEGSEANKEESHEEHELDSAEQDSADSAPSEENANNDEKNKKEPSKASEE